MRTHAGTLVVGVVGALLITAGLAAAAERCHQDLPGTRSLALEAHVTSYRFSGGRVVVRWARSEDCTGTAAWDYASQRRTTAAPLVCRRAAVRELASVPRLAASDARHAVRVLLAPESSDVPDRLLVFERATNRRLAAWPLLDRPARVAVHDGIAILSASSRNALYALRLADMDKILYVENFFPV